MVNTASPQAEGVAVHSTTNAEFAASVAKKIKGMSAEQFKESLVRTGIISEGGKLAGKYKR